MQNDTDTCIDIDIDIDTDSLARAWKFERFKRFLSTCSSLLIGIAVQWRAPASYPQLHPGLEGSLGQERGTSKPQNFVITF